MAEYSRGLTWDSPFWGGGKLFGGSPDSIPKMLETSDSNSLSARPSEYPWVAWLVNISASSESEDGSVK